MQLHVTRRDGAPFYLQIVNQVKYLAASGALAAGEQLPPVRKLADQLLLTPNTVARAYRELEADGVVEARRGAGVFIAEGVSPLARREQSKILHDRIDTLLAEAQQMNVDIETLLEMVRRRHRKMESA